MEAQELNLGIPLTTLMITVNPQLQQLVEEYIASTKQKAN